MKKTIYLPKAADVRFAKYCDDCPYGEAEFLVSTPDTELFGCRFEDICKRVYGIVVRNWRDGEDA